MALPSEPENLHRREKSAALPKSTIFLCFAKDSDVDATTWPYFEPSMTGVVTMGFSAFTIVCVVALYFLK
jgi:hypothetical protein